MASSVLLLRRARLANFSCVLAAQECYVHDECYAMLANNANHFVCVCVFSVFTNSQTAMH